ncbi:MAG: glycosyltransferase family 2 protein [Paracoccaceae bacterium]
MSDSIDAQAPAYAVVIPHYNDMVRLKRCLTALVSQDLNATEVVVADNATPADLTRLKESFPQVRFVTQPIPGAAAARNKGVEGSSAPWIFFLDADCVPSETWLAQARAIAAGDPNTVTGGRITVFDETPPPRSGAEAFETVFAFDQARYVREAGFSVTANLVTHRAVFAAAGPMVVGVSEDVDWCHRAVGTGATLIYDAELIVAHPTRQDWPALVKKWRRMTEEGFGLSGEGLVGRAKWLGKALLMPASVLAHLPRIILHRDLSQKEKIRAAATLIRLRAIRMYWMVVQALKGRK